MSLGNQDAGGKRMATHMISTQSQITSLIEEMDLGVVQKTMSKIASFQAVIQQALKREHDYGVIPGTLKPTLLKPGGEKICMVLGVNPEYELMDTTQDYEKGFFAYNIRCTLKKGTRHVAQGVGNCNSFEKRYRWINSDYIPEDVDPTSARQFIDKYGRRKYKIPNPNPWDLANTILKIAKKRAFIDAVLQVASLSEIFTQDLEDIHEYIQAEQEISNASITPKEAAAIKINFGKYKGSTLKDIYKEDNKYFEWMAENTKDDVIRSACQIMKEATEENEKK